MLFFPFLPFCSGKGWIGVSDKLVLTEDSDRWVGATFEVTFTLALPLLALLCLTSSQPSLLFSDLIYPVPFSYNSFSSSVKEYKALSYTNPVDGVSLDPNNDGTI